MLIAAEVKDGKVISGKDAAIKLSKTIEGAAHADGTWQKTWEPKLLQSFCRKEADGVYTVVHNLNTLKYSVSLSVIKSNGGCFIKEMGPVSFTFEIRDENQQLVSKSFHFAISLINDNN